MLSATVFVISTILLTVLLRPESIKKWLADSGIYEVSASEIRTQVQQSLPGEATNSQLVGLALQRSITKEQVKSVAEKGIDDSFTWLNREGNPPEFNFNETEIRTTLADQIVTGLRQRAGQLPTCSRQNPPLTSDIFTVNCLPPETDIEAQLAEVKAEISQSTGLDTTNPSEEQGTANQNLTANQDIITQLQDYRQAYQWLQLAPILATILFIVSGVITLALINPPYKFLRTLGLVFVSQAILYLIAGWVAPQAVQSSSDAILTQTTNTPFAQSTQNISLAVANTISSSFTKAGLIMGILSVLLLITHTVINKKMKPSTTDPAQEPEPNSSVPSS